MALRDDVGERARARVGSVIRAKWRLDAVIGIGGMASVYAATHRNQSRVAIKMLHPEVAIDKEVTSRFLREGYVANAVGHPGTVRVVDDDVAEDGAPFLVMELLEGETLGERLDHPGPLSFEEATSVGDQLLDVLAAAHERQIVHRDIKPDNLFLTRDGQVKVLDFGIARLRELSLSTGAATRVGSLLGTPAFMAPEQALGHWHEVDGRTDIWAVGATLYALLSGFEVHEADNVQAQLVFAATRRAKSLVHVVPNAPPGLVRVVDRALAFDRTERWSDARSMQAALREAARIRLAPGTLRSEAPPGLVSGAASRTPGRLGAIAIGTLDQEPTLIAPSSGPAAVSSDTFSTAQTMTRSSPGAPSRPGGARPLRVGMGLVLLLGAVGGAVLFLRPPTDHAVGEQVPPGTPGHTAAVGPPHPATAPPPTIEPAPRVEPASTILTVPSGTPSASSTPPPQHAVLRPTRGGKHLPPGPSASPPSDTNPFDRRH